MSILKLSENINKFLNIFFLTQINIWQVKNIENKIRYLIYTVSVIINWLKVFKIMQIKCHLWNTKPGITPFKNKNVKFEYWKIYDLKVQKTQLFLSYVSF